MAWIRKVIVLVLVTVFGHVIWPISERLGEAATTEWINHQIAERYGIVSPSQQQVIDFAISWALPAALAVFLVYAVFRAGAWWERRRVAMPAVATVSAPAPTTQIASRPPSSRAKIIFGTGHPFETVAQSGVNRSRTVRVKILNETDAEISNGMLQLLGLDPPNRDHKDFLLKNGVTIGPRGHIFVDIAAYNEGTSQAKPGPWIRLLIPIPGGYLFSSLPGNLPITPHTFHLRFSSLEGGTLDEVYCRFSVDQNHILHLEDWGDSAKLSNASIAEREISLFEAATRAYERTKDSPISIVIEGFANSSDDILIRLCDELVRPQNGRPLVKLRGNKPPSREKEEIYIDHLDRWEFVVERNTMVLQEPNSELRYESLSVSASEVEAAIHELASREV